MRTFQHHPDGLIFSGEYQMSLSEFRTHIDPIYRLPTGARGRFYERGLRHWLSYVDGDVPQDLEWPQGDMYAELIRAYFENLDAPPPQDAPSEPNIEDDPYAQRLLAYIQKRVDEAVQKRLDEFIKTLPPSIQPKA